MGDVDVGAQVEHAANLKLKLSLFPKFSNGRGEETPWVDSAWADCAGFLLQGAAGAPVFIGLGASDCAPEVAFQVKSSLCFAVRRGCLTSTFGVPATSKTPTSFRFPNPECGKERSRFSRSPGCSSADMRRRRQITNRMGMNRWPARIRQDHIVVAKRQEEVGQGIAFPIAEGMLSRSRRVSQR